MPSLEITTRIGRRVMCAYCPQDQILGAYSGLKGGGHMLSLVTFEKCLDHLLFGRLPLEVPAPSCDETHPVRFKSAGNWTQCCFP